MISQNVYDKNANIKYKKINKKQFYEYIKA